MLCHFTAATSRGQRDENQDNMRVDTLTAYLTPGGERSFEGVFADDKTHVFCVCDGIGGESMGDIAAMHALQAVNRTVQTFPHDAALETIAHTAAQAAHRQVCQFYERVGEIGGTTIVILAVRDTRYCLLNIGDSPAFHYSSSARKCTELSVRHNLETQKKSMGLPVGWGDASCLTAYLGAPDSAEEMAHSISGTLRDGDALLICTDGVTNAYDMDSLCGVMREDIPAEQFVNRAAAVSFADNCTAIHLHFQNDVS